MKILTKVFLCVFCLVVCGEHCFSESFAAGDIKLSASSIIIEKQLIKATGSPKLSTPDTSITAKTIELKLARGQTGKLTVTSASAIGGVTIQARQIDKETKASRTVDATAESATFVPEEDKVVLKGNARVKISDPDLEEPAVLTGKVINVYLKAQRIEALGEQQTQAELSVKPKPKSPK